MTDDQKPEGKSMIFARQQPQPQQEPPFDDDDDVESAISSLVQQTQSPVRRLRDIPALVQPLAGVSDAGQMSAQAMAIQYEQTAKAMEAMAQELISLAHRCDQDTMVVIKDNEQVQIKISAVVKECHRAAMAYRQEAQAVSAEIQKSSKLADDARRAAQQAIARIRARTPSIDEGEPAASETNTSDDGEPDV